MYLRTLKERYINRRWNTEQIRHKDVFACDECGREYTLGHKATHATNGALTFCSKPCNKKARSTGKLAEQWKCTKLERYGVEYSSQILGAGQKMIATRVKRTGAKAPSDHRSSSNEKFRMTMQERYGVEYPMQSADVREKARQSWQERYSVDNPFSAGSQFRLDHEELSIAGQKGYRSTCQKSDWLVSEPERVLVEWLRQRYKHVETQVPVKHSTRRSWLIDAHIVDTDTYVQLDGEFWHGLDKPYTELHPKGREAFDRDRAQDEWFASQGKRLVRITDKELATCCAQNNWDSIVLKLGG